MFIRKRKINMVMFAMQSEASALSFDTVMDPKFWLLVTWKISTQERNLDWKGI